MSLRTDLDRLIPGLSPRERAVLVLRTFKAKKPQDQRLAHGMLPDESREYNRLIRLMNVCNLEVLTMIMLLRGRCKEVELKLGWLATLEMWGEHADMIELYLKHFTKEPIVESAYRALIEAQPERWAPVSELADVLTSRKTDWKPEEIEDPENGVVQAEAWQEESKRQEVLLASLVKARTLQGRRRGGELEIRVASFESWLGEEVPVKPEFGFDYDVAPDAEADLVARLQRNRAEIRRTFTTKALRDPTARETERHSPLYWALAGGLRFRLIEDVKTTWGELLALDAALARIAEEFGDEDALRPETRTDVDQAFASLKEAQSGLEGLGVEVELPGLDDDEVRQNVEYIHYFAER